MSKILLDYFFPISTITPTAQASTAFLRQVCVVVSPKVAVPTGTPTLCTTMSQVEALTDNDEAQQLFNAGLSRVYILPMDDLNLSSAMASHAGNFFTLLISSDFDKDDVEASQATLVDGALTFTAVEAGWDGNDISVILSSGGTAGSEVVTVVGNEITVQIEDSVSTNAQIKAAIEADQDASALITASITSGQESTAQSTAVEANLSGGDGLTLGIFSGVTGISSPDQTFLTAQAVIERRCAFHTTAGNKAKNMFFAFGKLLSDQLNWLNQQYIQMPATDDVDTLGEATNLFDLKISFSLSDDEYGQRLGLFAAGGKAITAPYIQRNLEIDLQSEALSYISANQPAYSLTQASLLEDELQKVVDDYISRQLITSGSAEVKLEQDDFVASGYFTIAEPTAFWRIVGQIQQS